MEIIEASGKKFEKHNLIEKNQNKIREKTRVDTIFHHFPTPFSIKTCLIKFVMKKYL